MATAWLVSLISVNILGLKCWILVKLKDWWSRVSALKAIKEVETQESRAGDDAQAGKEPQLVDTVQKRDPETQAWHFQRTATGNFFMKK